MGNEPRNIPEIAEAIELLEEFEGHLPDVSNIDLFYAAIGILNEYVEEYPDTPHMNFITNLKMSYTRRILQHLKSIDSSEIDTWFNILIALIKVKDEFEALSTVNRDFKDNYDDFLAEWKGTYELKQIIGTVFKEKSV